MWVLLLSLVRGGTKHCDIQYIFPNLFPRGFQEKCAIMNPHTWASLVFVTCHIPGLGCTDKIWFWELLFSYLSFAFASEAHTQYKNYKFLLLPPTHNLINDLCLSHKYTHMKNNPANMWGSYLILLFLTKM